MKWSVQKFFTFHFPLCGNETVQLTPVKQRSPQSTNYLFSSSFPILGVYIVTLILYFTYRKKKNYSLTASSLIALLFYCRKLNFSLGQLGKFTSDSHVWHSVCSADLCEKEPFLNTEEGAPFRSVFKHVRLQYIINDLASARILERDNILPPGKARPLCEVGESVTDKLLFLTLFLRFPQGS